MRIVLLACTAMLWPAGVGAAWTGQVRSAGPDPSPVAGVAVTDGTRIVRTDAAGRYTLPEGKGAGVQITCPDDYACPDWYREGGGGSRSGRRFTGKYLPRHGHRRRNSSPCPIKWSGGIEWASHPSDRSPDGL